MFITEAEYNDYKHTVLSKCSGANIHMVTSKVCAIGGFIQLIAQRPEKEACYNEIIERTKSEIYKLINS